MGGRGHSKTARITFRIPKRQKEILEIIADYGGLSLSDLMRLLCQSLIYKFKTGQPIVFFEVNIYNEEADVHLPDKAKRVI